MLLATEDVLRTARILDYQRFSSPSMELMEIPGTSYEYVQFEIHKGCCITCQRWQKAIVGDESTRPNFNKTRLKEMIQNNKIRVRKPIETSELCKLLEEHALMFNFPYDLNITILPKSKETMDTTVIVNDIEQRSIDWNSPLHKQWFNKEFAESSIGKDWRYLLNLNWPKTDPTNVLYNYFEGIYPGDINELKKMCIKGTKSKKIRIYKERKFSNFKEEKVKRRQEAEDHITEQLAKYKGPKQSNKGQPGSPYMKHQIINVWPAKSYDSKGKVLERYKEGDIETMSVKRYEPTNEWREYEKFKYKNGTYTIEVWEKQIWKEVWVEYKRPVQPIKKSVLVFQIPSRLSMRLHELKTEKSPFKTPKDATLLTRIVRNYTKQYGDDKWKKYFCEKDEIIRPTYENYTVKVKVKNFESSKVLKHVLKFSKNKPIQLKIRPTKKIRFGDFTKQQILGFNRMKASQSKYK